jgi:hypothetical protein
MIRPMVKEDLFMLTVIYMRETGQMIRHKEEVYMSIWMEPNILETGKKIDSMDMELKLGRMELSMKEIMN